MAVNSLIITFLSEQKLNSVKDFRVLKKSPDSVCYRINATFLFLFLFSLSLYFIRCNVNNCCKKGTC